MDVGATLWQGIQGSLPLILIVVVGLVVVGILKGGTRRGDGQKKQAADLSTGYESRSTLFSPTEAKFLETLRRAAPHLEVFGKVRLEDIVQVRSGSTFGETSSRRNHIKSRHVDYVLCEPVSTRIVVLVELDDRSHRSSKAQRSDSIKDAVLEGAGVALLRVPVSAVNDAEGVARRLASAGVGGPNHLASAQVAEA